MSTTFDITGIISTGGSIHNLADGSLLILSARYGSAYIQRFSQSGEALSERLLVSSNYIEDEIVTLSNNRLVILLREGNGFDGQELVAREFDISANTLGEPTSVFQDELVSSWTSATNPNGGYVVVYQAGEWGDYSLVQASFDATGALSGTAVLATSESGFSWAESLWLSDSTYAVTYLTGNTYAEAQRVELLIVDANSQAVANELILDQSFDGFELSPVLEALANGGWIALWELNSWSGSGPYVRYQLFDQQGIANGDIQIHASESYPADGWSYQVTALNDGGWLLTWESSLEGQVITVGQRFDASGDVSGAEFEISALDTWSRHIIAAKNDGGWMIAWDDTSQNVLITQTYSSNGDLVEPESETINSAATGIVSIEGDLDIGDTLTATDSIEDDNGVGEFNYQWMRDDVFIPDATSSDYVLTEIDANTNISVVVSFTDGAGFDESIASESVAIEASEPLETVEQFTGNKSDYFVYVDPTNNDQTIVIDLRMLPGAEGRRTVLEYTDKLDFSGEELALSDSLSTAVVIDDDQYHWNSEIGLPNGDKISASEAQLYRTYYGAMQRTPDDGGYTWWLGEIEAGRQDLRSMAAGFLWSDEFLGYVDAPDGNSIPNNVFLTHMYRGVFGREPDGDGYNWWLSELETGNRTQVDVLVDMTQSNEYVELTKVGAVDYLCGVYVPTQPETSNDWPEELQDYIDSADSSTHDGYNNGYLEGYMNLVLQSTGVNTSGETFFGSDNIGDAGAYDAGFDEGYADGFSQDDYAYYFIANENSPYPDSEISFEQLAKASGYLDGYRDGMVEYVSEQWFSGFLSTDFSQYSPEEIDGYLLPYQQGYDAGVEDGNELEDYDYFYPSMDQMMPLYDLFG